MTTHYKTAIEPLLQGQHLSAEQTDHLFRQIMAGELSSAQLAAILIALRIKGESVTEIVAAARVMRDHVIPVHVDDTSSLVDMCGTGGDGAGSFNISTAAMFVAAAAGARVAKHGGRGVSSTSGSADVMEALGVNLQLTPEIIAQSIDQLQIGFMFAPNHHPSMKHAAPTRREIGVRSIFNLLGPLTNPASAKRQLLGVFADTWLEPMAQALAELGSEHAMIVHCHGLDELALTGPSQVCEYKEGQRRRYSLTPEDCGLRSSNDPLPKVTDAQQSSRILMEIFSDVPGVARDTVIINAAAAIYVGGVCDNIREGVAIAQEVIRTGTVMDCLNDYVEFSQGHL